MRDWDILLVLILPVIACALCLFMAVMVAIHEWRHRKDQDA